MGYFIVVFAFLVFIAGVGIWDHIRCKHNWKEIESGEIHSISRGVKIGVYKVHECQHCKKLKTEKTKFYDGYV